MNKIYQVYGNIDLNEFFKSKNNKLLSEYEKPYLSDPGGLTLNENVTHVINQNLNLETSNLNQEGTLSLVQPLTSV
jgi:hypothetical protein